MRVLLQRVERAEVRIDGRSVAAIGRGYLLLVGFHGADSVAALDWMATKVSGLRLFADEAGKMNRDLDDVAGQVLVVSQFTLYGDARKGRRPSFVAAAEPETAVSLYRRFLTALESRLPERVQSGEFGALMQVELVNDGPVTLLLER
ncbi:MAG: D-aminoacyl-tRNA deacylase [Longimicrobiales bacterium]